SSRRRHTRFSRDWSSDVCSSDLRFYHHNGVDLRAVIRVGLKTILFRQKSSGGGSTISQQLAKILYKRPSLKGKNRISRASHLIQIGRASCRERGKISVLGVALKK